MMMHGGAVDGLCAGRTTVVARRHSFAINVVVVTAVQVVDAVVAPFPMDPLHWLVILVEEHIIRVQIIVTVAIDAMTAVGWRR